MNKSNFLTFIAILSTIIASSSYAGGGGEIPAPVITLDLPEISYISPAGEDGIQDEINWSVTIAASQNMVVKGYRVVVSDSSGQEIYIGEEQYPGSQPAFEQFLINLGFVNLKKAMTVPETLSWNGTTTSETAADEGHYTLRIEGWDDKDRTGVSAEYTIILDNTPPTAELAFQYTVFSPNADEKQDILIVEQAGSEEKLWTGTIFDADDNTVYEATWENQAPTNLIWDGTTSDGIIAEDGTYTYVLSATDLAGNSFETEAQSIAINTKDTPLSVSRNVGHFSPNDDESLDTIEFLFGVPITDGIREWTFEILNVSSEVGETLMRKMTGNSIRSNWIFDGKSSGGMVLPEGTYLGRLSVLYDNGNNPSAQSSEFVIDITSPTVSVKAFPEVFSPNGDGNKDTVQIYQETSAEETWIGRIYSVEGEIVREIHWPGRAESTISWNGRDDNHELVDDGEYRYVLLCLDKAGNYADAEIDRILLDTRETPIALGTDSTYFSPNADGIRDELTILPDITDPAGITVLDATITDESGKLTRNFAFTTDRDEIVWDGKNEVNQSAPDGSYFIELDVTYEHGNNPSARIGPIVIDRLVPTADVSANVTIFSPDGDGKQDQVTVMQTASSEEDAWRGTIVSETGTTARTFQWSGVVESFVWDGSDEAGNQLPDGHYRYTLTSTDKAGNVGTFVIDRITIDTRETPIALRIGSSSFSPNGDQIKDDMVLKPVLQVTDNIASWNLEILSDEVVVRTFSGVSNVPAAIEFDGNDDDGNRLPEREYTAGFSVIYRNGTDPSTTSPPFSIDVTKPNATISVDPPLFSPNSDGQKDVTIFTQDGSDEESWNGWIVDTDSEAIRSFNWYGKLASELVWDGKDDNGRIVPNGSYYYSLSSIDRAGNTWESESVRVRIDSRPTSVSLSIEPDYISPNGDEIQDTLRIIPTVTLNEEIETHVVEILDANGEVVRSFGGSGRLPRRITWNGNKADGSSAPDGSYSARIRLKYAKGDSPFAESTEFQIDTTRPSATIGVDLPLFSPNGDGQKDGVTFSQEGSKEETWHGRITDEKDIPVRTFRWFGELATEIAWDGKDENGRAVPDGSYFYSISSSDRAGNAWQSEAVRVNIDSRRTSISLAIEPEFISPNGDKVQDTVRITPTVALNEGIESHTVQIIDAAGDTVVSFDESGRLPGGFVWNGKTTEGTTAPDGTYSARVSLVYAKGDLPSVESAIFTIDTIAPTATIASDLTLFSPDGDGRKDVIVISQETSNEERWEGTIQNSAGRVVRSEYWEGSAEDFVWNGRGLNGSIVPDGTYRYVISASDRAGNRVSRNVSGIVVDARRTSAEIRPSTRSISPNGDGAADETRLSLETSLNEGIERWSLEIEDAEGKVIRDLTGEVQTRLPRYVMWDGRNDAGNVVDGYYTPKLTMSYAKGNYVEAEIEEPIQVDISGPTFNVILVPTPFSPDDDGDADTLRITFTSVADASPVVNWSLAIIDPYGNTFYERGGTGRPPTSLRWNGYSDDGELVQAAEDYRIVTRLTDAMGNVGERTSVLPVDILVIREGDALKIRISSIQFAPNSPEFLGFDEEKSERNLKTLTRLAEILKKYSSYQIRIEGHAVSVYWENEARAKIEEEEELQPLSQARADAVKDALVDLGIPAMRMNTVGMGGTQPIVPHGDIENRWKSRRVEFILIR